MGLFPFKLIHKHLSSKKEETEKEKQIARDLIGAAAKTPEEVYESQNTSLSGLSNEEVKQRIEQYGNNSIVHEKMKPWYVQLLQAFNNPFNYVLLVLATVSFFTDDYTGMTIILVMVSVSATIKFFVEYRSKQGAEALKKMVHITCSVIRKNEEGKSAQIEIPLSDLVPGDVIHLGAGDIIPADVRLIHCKNLFISQSALTGESLPIEKDETTISANSVKNALELKNICFMGTNVNSGTATAVVLSTGSSTYFGSMAATLAGTVNQTSFDIGISKVSWLLIKFMMFMVPVVFFITGFTKGNWIDAMMFALSVAVGLTPEMLPMVVTSNLAKGAIKMAKESVIVKKLSAIQDFGAMDVLCTDKTGTLTEDRIVLMKYTDIYLDNSIKALQYAYLNSHFETGMRNLMDTAILNSQYLQDKEQLEKSWQMVDELPFDFERRRMSVILKQDDKRLLICKGAVEEMLSCAAKVDTPQGETDITPEIKQLITKNLQGLYKDGLRVVAVGHKYLAPDHNETYAPEEESNLILDGFMSFLDPPKESAGEALNELKNNGIRVMVLTGDNDVIAQKVCSEVGLEDQHVVLGSDIENLSDEDAINLIEQHQIFAKLAPMQKSRIVRLLRQKGHVVGFMGDGINDAVSLREADIGISVDTAVDIAKESADIILLQKNLLVLSKGVIEGRKMFANTMKYIKITASSNFGNVFSLLGASYLFPFLPMLPLQILILNLIYDISQVAIPWDNVDADYLKKPRKWIATDIKRFMIFIGPTSSIFDYATFGLMYLIICPMMFKGLGYGDLSVADQLVFAGIFQTGWFLESLFTQTLIVQVLRTEKIPFLQSRASWQLLLSAAVLLTVGVTLPYTAIGKTIGFHPVPFHFYLWLVAFLISYCTLTQFVKRWYIRKFNSWI